MILKKGRGANDIPSNHIKAHNVDLNFPNQYLVKAKAFYGILFYDVAKEAEGIGSCII